jgi:hypothetical protein
VRVHNAEEAMVVKPIETVDHMLWLIDVYDIKSGCATAVHNLLMSTYHVEQERIPGILPRWTKTMLTWVTLLHCLDNASDCSEALKWAKRNNLLTTNCQWNAADVLTMLDAIAMRWNAITPCKELTAFLNMIWCSCKKWTMNKHRKTSESMEKSGDWYTLKPVSIMAMLSRYYWFNQTLAQLKWFPSADVVVPQAYFHHFINKEKRHLKITKFREELSNAVWQRVMYCGDREIATHDQLGDYLSAYSCLYKRRPICLMQKYQRMLSYGTYDEICVQFSDILWLQLIRSHFINNYQMDFLKFFVCWEVDQHKHQTALNGIQAPVILERFGSYTVLLDGKVYGNGPIDKIFPIWVHLAKNPHGCQMEMLKRAMFEFDDTEEL